jgi:hypothetical protein
VASVVAAVALVAVGLEPGRARLCRQCRACGGVQPFGGGAGCGGLGGVLLGVAESGDGFGECGQPGDEHDRGHGAVAGQVGERG